LEALFRTGRYGSAYPAQGFASLEEARAWMPGFVADYNTVHRHRGIRFVTPSSATTGWIRPF